MGHEPEIHLQLSFCISLGRFALHGTYCSLSSSYGAYGWVPIRAVVQAVNRAHVGQSGLAPLTPSASACVLSREHVDRRHAPCS